MPRPPSRSPSRSPAQAGRSSHSPRSSTPRNQAPRAPVDTLQQVAGLPAVEALFARRPTEVDRLFFTEAHKTAAEPFCQELASRHKPFRQVEPDELAKIAGTALHGGIVAGAKPMVARRFDAVEVKAWAEAGAPLLLLDGVGNPHNLGAIVRSMAFFGLPRLIVSDNPSQALPSEASLRVAEGGFEWLELYRAERFPIALKRLREAGYRVVGTALDGAQPLAGMPRNRPLAFVLGNEEGGLPAATLAACDSVIKLPGSGRVQSLNVAATAAILAWELIRLTSGAGR